MFSLKFLRKNHLKKDTDMTIVEQKSILGYNMVLEKLTNWLKKSI